MELPKQPPINLDRQVPSLSDYIRSVCLNSTSVPKNALRDLINTFKETYNFNLFMHSDQISCLATTKKYIVTGSHDNSIYVWSSQKQRLKSVLIGHTQSISHLVITTDNKVIVSGSDDKTIRKWEIKENSHLILGHHPSQITSIVLTTDNYFVYSSSNDLIQAWDLRTGCQNFTMRNSLYFKFIRVMADGNFAVERCDRNLTIFNTDLLYPISYEKVMEGSYNFVAVSKNFDIFIISRYKSLHVCYYKSNVASNQLNGHSKYITSIALSNSEKFVVSGSLDTTIRIWSLLGIEKAVLKGQNYGIICVSITEDDKFIVSASKEKAIQIWNLLDETLIRKLKGHCDTISAISISSLHNTLVTGSKDRAICLWDLDKRSQITSFSKGHKKAITCLMFCKGDQFIISGSIDGNLCVWDVRKNNCVVVIKGHAGAVTSILMIKNNSLIVSGSSDQTYRVWKTKQIVEKFSVIAIKI